MSPHKESTSGASPFAVLAALLAVPAAATIRLVLQVDGWIPAVGLALLSLIAYTAHYRDKRSAEAGRERTPESVLHMLEMLGGWPGAYLAQRQFRHKGSKFSYQAVFWMIVAVHELVALDYLLGWSIAGWAWHSISS